MSVFIDTSGILAGLVLPDRQHEQAKKTWESLIHSQEILHVTNYVVVELTALLQKRHGVEIVQRFQENFLPLLEVIWVDESLHRSSMAALLTARRRSLSFVDCVSFEVMRWLDIKTVFTFDRHFKQQGFNCLPG